MSFTPPPDAPPASVAIPSRSLDDQVAFDTKTDTYLNWLATFRDWLATFTGWVGTFTAELATTQDQVQTSALAATDAAAAALAASNFKGLWASLAGPLAKPACVKHDGRFWMLLNNLADVSTSTPGVSADWTSIDAGNVIQVVTVNTTMQPGITYVVAAADVTLQAPVALLTGDRLIARSIVAGAFLADWNGHSVKSDPQTLPMSIPAFMGFDLTYTGSTLA